MTNSERNFSLINVTATPLQRRMALITAILITAVSLITLPFANKASIVIPSFLPIFTGIVFSFDLITSYLLFAQFRVTCSLPIVILSGTYLYSSLTAFLFLVTFPGTFSDTGLFGANTQTATWLWVFWHGGFPIGILCHLLMSNAKVKFLLTRKHVSFLSLLIILLIVTATILIIIFTTKYTHLLPTIIEQGNYFALTTSGIGPLICLLNLGTGLYLLYYTRCRSILHLWLGVAILASLLDSTNTLLSISRYTFGWYVARINSLFSSTVVLGALMYEVNSLYITISQREDFFRAIFERAGIGMSITDLKGNHLRSNRILQKFLGYTEKEFESLTLNDITQSEECIAEAPLLNQLINGEQDTYQLEKRYICKDGQEVWGRLTASLVTDLDGESSYVIRMVEDITQRKEAERMINYLAFHDPLTNLPNMRMFREKLKEALRWLSQNDGMFAVYFIDLDGFKSINDNFGHDVGDLLLQAVAMRLNSCVRKGDVVARMGGDEFTILLPSIDNKQEAITIAERIVTTLREPVILQGYTIEVTTSVGLSFAPDDGMDGEILMKKADTAMYLAKESGKNNYRSTQYIS
ncbi:diguanylate cyclase domain-containing protein [Pelosinus sp. sgz500959]|uniref:diguanylate cyclase domain-containing protein n=1 Tax=Pelosinus sp. sgz500959 TaxID=3242472 RepID=UPI00366AD55C